ncbi:hypothetical protein Tsubulata_010196 [Turnera subulata]|uniref:Uncharacterized protein n=1 Tax=Turnera subulata TaxID=218843 RepID=A0A9Q0J8R7_9ROSI|nr:hypothetical protein Tsubulata_010196 [Turnera subulata]
MFFSYLPSPTTPIDSKVATTYYYYSLSLRAISPATTSHRPPQVKPQTTKQQIPQSSLPGIFGHFLEQG